VNRWPKPEPQSALVVLVPAAEELVARFRATHDPAAAAGVPAHITTLFPFRTPAQIDVLTIEQLKACFCAYAPFDFGLLEIKSFPGLIYLARRWCTWPVQDEMTSNPKLLRDYRLATDGIRASGRQHPVQHSHADGILGLLASKAAGSQPRSDQRLVTTHCRFY
jgi:hypothetical protein